MSGASAAGGSSRFDVLVPWAVRRAVLANGEGGPMPFARGQVAGQQGELVGDRARLELRRGGAGTALLRLADWTAEEREPLLAVPPDTEAWRFSVTISSGDLAADVAKVKRGRSPLAEATRYWRLQGDAGTWFWGNGPLPEKGSRARTFHLRRDEPEGDPLVVVTVTAVGERAVESAVSALGEVARSGASSDLDEELAVLLAVGGFQGELVGRNERIGKAAKWLVDVATDEVTGPPYR